MGGLRPVRAELCRASGSDRAQQFRDRLVSVNHGDDAIDRLERLAGLANTRLSFIETIQVDTALS